MPGLLLTSLAIKREDLVVGLNIFQVVYTGARLGGGFESFYRGNIQGARNGGEVEGFAGGIYLLVGLNIVLPTLCWV